MMEETIEDAIVFFPDLSFNTANWTWAKAIVLWDEEKFDYAWKGIEWHDGTQTFFQQTYRLSADRWYFYNRYSLVESYEKFDEWFLINPQGEVLLTFPNGIPDDPTNQFMDTLGEPFYLDITYCLHFFFPVSQQNIREHNFGYFKEKKQYENGKLKYYFSNENEYWASCEFNIIETEWNTVGYKSLEYDALFNFQYEDGTCLVKNNNRFAIINRWFQRITPWFDELLPKNKLSELLDAEVEIPHHLLSVRIGNEIQILELCGNFMSDKLLNPLSFFKDKAYGIELYENTAPECVQDSIMRISVEEDYTQLDEFPNRIPYFFAYMNRYSKTDFNAFVAKHNQLMGITPSGYKIIQRFTLKELNAANKKITLGSPYQPGPGTNPKPKSFRFFN
jgi:hypothetical protein